MDYPSLSLASITKSPDTEDEIKPDDSAYQSLPQPGQIPGAPPGVTQLTPIGNGEPVINGGLNEDDLQQAQDTLQQEQMPTEGLPVPSVKGQAATVDPNGVVTFANGIKHYPDGHAEMQFSSGQKFVKLPGQTKFVPAPNVNQLVDLTDSTTGKPYKAVVNKNTGEIVKKLDDPGSRPGAQAETLRLRMLNSAKSQPGIQAYVNIKNNYDSLAQNAAIPEDQRTPADDAAAIQAFGGVEHPGTGVTDADKKQAEETLGRYSIVQASRLGVGNYLKGRTLDQRAVSEMRDAAKRALDGRQKTYNDEVAPLLQEAQRVGLKPGDVNGALGANIMPAEAAPQSQPVATPDTTGRVIGHPYTDPKSGITKIYAGNGQWLNQQPTQNPF